jgi:hypothetical protein
LGHSAPHPTRSSCSKRTPPAPPSTCCSARRSRLATSSNRLHISANSCPHMSTRPYQAPQSKCYLNSKLDGTTCSSSSAHLSNSSWPRLTLSTLGTASFRRLRLWAHYINTRSRRQSYYHPWLSAQVASHHHRQKTYPTTTTMTTKNTKTHRNTHKRHHSL